MITKPPPLSNILRLEKSEPRTGRYFCGMINRRKKITAETTQLMVSLLVAALNLSCNTFSSSKESGSSFIGSGGIFSRQETKKNPYLQQVKKSYYSLSVGRCSSRRATDNGQRFLKNSHSPSHSSNTP